MAQKGCISAAVRLVEVIGDGVCSCHGRITAAAVRLGGIRSVELSMVCSINHSPFLRVLPVDVQWIDVDSDLDYMIYSNTDWNIV